MHLMAIVNLRTSLQERIHELLKKKKRHMKQLYNIFIIKYVKINLI